MRILLAHPGPLTYSEIYLRLEPLGLERLGAALLAAGHEVRLVDLQVFSGADYARELRSFKPRAVGLSLNYLANLPEVVELAKLAKAQGCFVFVGGHSASFVAGELIEHGAGAIDCVLRGEGEAAGADLMEAIGDRDLLQVPGVVTAQGFGPPPRMVDSLESFLPARHLARRRRRYFIGMLDPCASVEFTRGCPWDCSFCSAWTFYGRSYRKLSPEAAAHELASIHEPNVFIVDDVAFVHPEDGFAIGHALEQRRIRKRYYLETRTDVLCRNQEVFAYWRRLGLEYMFLGLEAIDADALRAHRKRSSVSVNLQALEVARKLGLTVAINLIADPDWDEQRFRFVREWALSIPEIVHLTVATPYPGTEIWQTGARKLTTRDYRLFDIQHAVLPTRLPLLKFYQELVKTQAVIDRKHLGFAALRDLSWTTLGLLLRGQTNFVRMLWKFNQVYNADRQYADHFREVTYQIDHTDKAAGRLHNTELYVYRNPAATERTRAIHAAPVAMGSG
ncbi:MAG TPA: hopanoid C-3 methylase HpnR [Candidatus Binataceae bacterium]|nr:hopanoid C-3 methylase HpnR [Candidatus Binataceae bacterium]